MRKLNEAGITKRFGRLTGKFPEFAIAVSLAFICVTDCAAEACDPCCETADPCCCPFTAYCYEPEGVDCDQDGDCTDKFGNPVECSDPGGGGGGGGGDCADKFGNPISCPPGCDDCDCEEYASGNPELCGDCNDCSCPDFASANPGACGGCIDCSCPDFAAEFPEACSCSAGGMNSSSSTAFAAGAAAGSCAAPQMDACYCEEFECYAPCVGEPITIRSAKLENHGYAPMTLDPKCETVQMSVDQFMVGKGYPAPGKVPPTVAFDDDEYWVFGYKDQPQKSPQCPAANPMERLDYLRPTGTSDDVYLEYSGSNGGKTITIPYAKSGEIIDVKATLFNVESGEHNPHANPCATKYVDPNKEVTLSFEIGLWPGCPPELDAAGSCVRECKPYIKQQQDSCTIQAKPPCVPQAGIDSCCPGDIVDHMGVAAWDCYISYKDAVQDPTGVAVDYGTPGAECGSLVDRPCYKKKKCHGYLSTLDPRRFVCQETSITNLQGPPVPVFDPCN